MRSVRTLAAVALSLFAASSVAVLAAEPKHGGILKVYHRDSPASASIHEEATYSVNVPFMPIFNNLVIYEQHEPQNRMESIVPDLAESWAWSDDKKTLTFKLRQGVKWHDGKPFTVRRRQMHLRHAAGQVAAEVPQEPAQVLVRRGRRRHRQRRLRGRVQPEAAAAGAAGDARLRLYADLSLPRLARRHAHQADRHRPVQVRRVQAERIDQARQAIRTTGRRACRISTASSTPSSPNRSTAILGFISGQFDMTFPTEVTIPLLKDVKNAGAEGGVRGRADQRLHQHHHQLVDSPPFDNLDIRRAMALALDRKAFISIMFEGQADIGGTMLPPPGGLWAHAEGDAGDDSGLRPRRQRQPRRSAQADGRRPAMARTSGSRSRSPPATFRSTATPPSS